MSPVCSMCSCPWNVGRHSYLSCDRGNAHAMQPVPGYPTRFYCPFHDGPVNS